MILGALGLLHTQVGNFHIALGYLEQRDKLPYVDNCGGAGGVPCPRPGALARRPRGRGGAGGGSRPWPWWTPHRSWPGSSPWHWIARRSTTSPRAGSSVRWRSTIASCPPWKRAPATRRVCATGWWCGWPAAPRRWERVSPSGRWRTWTGLIATWRTPAVQATLNQAHATPQHVQRSYRIIAAGLRANAESRLGNLDAAARALEQRRALFLEQFAESDRDEDIRAVTLAEMRLAENAVDRRDTAQAARWLGKAIEHADTLIDRTHAPVDAGQLGRALVRGAVALGWEHAGAFRRAQASGSGATHPHRPA